MGFNAISPVNLCPEDNKTLPCPAPAGAVIPWDESPAELALPPDGRTGAGTFSSGGEVYLIGGAVRRRGDGQCAHDERRGRQLLAVAGGPALPEARTGAAVLNLSGTPYVIGGADANGAADRDGLHRHGRAGRADRLGDSRHAGAARPAGRPDRRLDGDRPVRLRRPNGRRIIGSNLPIQDQGAAGKLQAWTEMTELPLPEARARATAVAQGISIYVIGGEGPAA